MKLLAVDLGTLRGIGPLGGETENFAADPKTSLLRFNDFITLIVTLMTVIGFIWFIILIMTAAIAWLSSGGDKGKVQQAQKQITHGIIGIVIIISALFLIKLVEIVLGIKILGFYTIIRDL